MKIILMTEFFVLGCSLHFLRDLLFNAVTWWVLCFLCFIPKGFSVVGVAQCLKHVVHGSFKCLMFLYSCSINSNLFGK